MEESIGRHIRYVFLRTSSPEQPMDAPDFPVGGGEDGAEGWMIHAPFVKLYLDC